MTVVICASSTAISSGGTHESDAAAILQVLSVAGDSAGVNRRVEEYVRAYPPAVGALSTVELPLACVLVYSSTKVGLEAGDLVDRPGLGSTQLQISLKSIPWKQIPPYATRIPAI